MSQEQVAIQLPDGAADGILFRPDKSGRWPAVLHLTDVMGIRPATVGMAERLSALGYVVLQPNIFFRTAKPPVFDFAPNFADERTMKRFGELAGPLTPAVQARDAGGYIDFLARRADVPPERMGVVGYCFSGGYALRAAAARSDRIVVAASFHGGHLATDAPDSPHTVLPKVKARLYFGHAVDDRSMPPAMIEKLENALRAWGGRYESESYAGALHGWTVPGGPIYNEPQAERHFTKLTELLAATLK
jgi:carboxymethylenebutenolidase